MFASGWIRRSDDLMGASGIVALGVAAARATAATRRVIQGRSLDDIDRAALVELAELTTRAAKALQFFDTRGQAGEPPIGTFAERVDVAIEALATGVSPEQAKDLAQAFDVLSSNIQDFAKTPRAEEARQLLTLFLSLANGAMGDLSSVGETTAQL